MHHEVDQARAINIPERDSHRPIGGHHEVITYGMRSLLSVNHEGKRNDPAGSFLACFTSTVVPGGRGHVGVFDKLLHGGDVDPDAEEVRHERHFACVSRASLSPRRLLSRSRRSPN